MNRILHKIKNIYYKAQKHPLAKQKKVSTLFRYIYFNTYTVIFKNFSFKWLGKLNIIINKGDAGMVANYYFGLYEPEDSLFMLNHSDSSDVLLDIGANVGHYALLCSGIKKMQVIAIEPIVTSINKLKENAKRNKIDTIHYINKGVSNNKTSLKFSNDKGVMNHVVADNYKNFTTVEVDTVDSILDQLNIYPTMMKIDVEGHELKVLQGAKNLLESEKLNVILVELNWMLDSKEDEYEIIKLLKSYKYKPYFYNVNTNGLSELEYKNEKQFNTVFIKNIDLANEKLIKNKSFLYDYIRL